MTSSPLRPLPPDCHDVNDPADRVSIDLIAEFASQADVAASTREKYRVHLEEFHIWLNHPSARTGGRSRTQLLDVRPGDVRRFMSYLAGEQRFAAREHHRVRGSLSPSARKNFLSSIRSFYRYLVSVELLDVDPSAAVRPPRVVTKPGIRLSARELRLLLDAPGSPRSRIVTYLLAYTAARAEEIRTLRWRDLDLSARTITVHGKGDKYRVIDIHPALMAELRRWQLHEDEQVQRTPLLRTARSNPDTNFVLLTRRGRPLAKTAISKQLKARAARVGLRVIDPKHDYNKSEVSPHALRRSFATLLLNEGHHLDAVADVLGHASVDTTRKHYAFASSARRRATIEAFNV